MKTHLWEQNQIRKIHAFKLLAIFVLINITFYGQSVNNFDEVLVKKEIKRTKNNKITDSIFLDFNLNDYLKEFLNEKCILIIDSNFVIKKNELSSLVNQLEHKNIDIRKLNLSCNCKFSNIENERNSLNNSSIRLMNYISKTRLFLSYPLITENEKYALIANAYGKMGSLVGGINVYINKNDRWVFYESINDWIE